MKNNTIREAMEGRRLAFGTHCSSQDIGLYEICGRIGYDYVWIDNEHAGMTFPMIYNGIVGSAAGGAAALVRVGGHETDNIKPVLEMGPEGIVVPMVNTAGEAEKIVSRCQYPPAGTRGFGPLRAIDYYQTPMEEYLAAVNQNTLCMLQCEHAESVENLDEILEVPGVDAIICGPVDLSASVGKLGRLNDPEVMALMAEIIRKCRAARKPFGVSVGYNWPLIEYWVTNGASFVSMGTAYDYFSMTSRWVLGKVRRGDFHRPAEKP